MHALSSNIALSQRTATMVRVPRRAIMCGRLPRTSPQRGPPMYASVLAGAQRSPRGPDDDRPAFVRWNVEPDRRRRQSREIMTVQAVPRRRSAALLLLPAWLGSCTGPTGGATLGACLDVA